MTRDALVVGRGVAALASAHLLRRRGWTVNAQRQPPGPLPTLVLGTTTCELLRHVFGAEPDPLRGAHRLAGRVVAWGADAQPAVVSQQAAVIDQALLLARLDEVVLRAGNERAERPLGGEAAAGWVVDASGRSSTVAATLGNARRRTVGARTLVAQDMTLTRRAPRAASMIETVPGGWLFLAPGGGDRGLLQAMVPQPTAQPAATIADMLEDSRLVAPALGGPASEVKVFAAAPRILTPLCGPGWIAVGDAATALDPICGDGTGHGLRAALLAAAVLEANADADAWSGRGCLRHYEVRVHKAFLDHLRACVSYYSGGWTSDVWTGEIASMTSELKSEGSRRIDGAPLRYGLYDEQLVAL